MVKLKGVLVQPTPPVALTSVFFVETTQYEPALTVPAGTVPDPGGTLLINSSPPAGDAALPNDEKTLVSKVASVYQSN